MSEINNYLHIIAKKQAQKVNEADIKLTVPIIMPISKELIGYLTL